MKILRALSVLLDYPTENTISAQTELAAIIGVADLAPTELHALRAFIAQRCNGDLLEWQAEYDGLFERGRSLSLLLFEHVHGESRDRGQAMVDLLNQYHAAGLDIDINELPDYIPLYLEFLSTQGEENARLGLQEVAHILALLACRLEERHSDYASIFHALLQLSGMDIDLGELRNQLVQERRDDTPEALDKVWEEEAVTFTAQANADTCGVSRRPLPGQRRDLEQQLNLA
jgi:nitrate reductase delta subunit